MAGRGQKRNDVVKKLIPRGFLESYIISFLKKKPMHGYLLMNKIEDKTGFWKPSPGTIYPALHSLEKKGFIVSQKIGQKKRYSLTNKGKRLSIKIGNIQKTMRDEMSDVFSEILDVEKEEFLDFFKKLKKDKRRKEIFSRIHKLIILVAKIQGNDTEIIKAKKVLDEANEKLSGIALHKVNK